MPNNPASATEESGSTPLSGAVVLAENIKETPRAFLQAARRNLTEEDLDTPAARRFLLAEIERLDQICTDHEGLITHYHDQRVTIAELTLGSQVTRKNDLLSFVCLSVGSAGIGAAPGYFGLAGGTAYGIVVLLGSVLLFAAGILSKVLK
jgi:hypothetical protein